jgi:hypothetical protein
MHPRFNQISVAVADAIQVNMLLNRAYIQSLLTS